MMSGNKTNHGQGEKEKVRERDKEIVFFIYNEEFRIVRRICG